MTLMLEANACGLPIAAYPVTGPIDVVREGVNGALDEHLETACVRALQVSRAACPTYAQSQSWRRVAEVLLSHVVETNLARGQGAHTSVDALRERLTQREH